MKKYKLRFQYSIWIFGDRAESFSGWILWDFDYALAGLHILHLTRKFVNFPEANILAI